MSKNQLVVQNKKSKDNFWLAMERQRPRRSDIIGAGTFVLLFSSLPGIMVTGITLSFMGPLALAVGGMASIGTAAFLVHNIYHSADLILEYGHHKLVGEPKDISKIASTISYINFLLRKTPHHDQLSEKQMRKINPHLEVLEEYLQKVRTTKNGEPTDTFELTRPVYDESGNLSRKVFKSFSVPYDLSPSKKLEGNIIKGKMLIDVSSSPPSMTVNIDDCSIYKIIGDAKNVNAVADIFTRALSIRPDPISFTLSHDDSLKLFSLQQKLQKHLEQVKIFTSDTSVQGISLYTQVFDDRNEPAFMKIGFVQAPVLSMSPPPSARLSSQDMTLSATSATGAFAQASSGDARLASEDMELRKEVERLRARVDELENPKPVVISKPMV